MNFSAQKQKRGSYYASVFTKLQQYKLNIKPFMRVSFLITALLISTLQLLLAVPTHGQDMTVEKVTVSLKQQELTNAFKQIEQQTTLRFFYRKAEVDKLAKLNLAPERRTIERTLFELLHNTSFTFRQIDQNILIETNGQSPNVKTRISGKVLAKDNNQPVRAARIELLRSADLQLVGQAFTDSIGRFEIITQDNSLHIIRIALMGYHVYRTQVADGNEVGLPEIYLEPDPKLLKEVVIAARTPLVKQEVDRLVYNVQGDPDNKTSTVLDILGKVPLVSVNADGDIKLKGSSSFKVLIDGRTSSLVANNPSDIFRVMPASSIASIEVITIPPAKYDSEGLAGIINVITVKKKLDGYTGNLGFQYKFPNGPRNYSNFTFKSGKFAMSVSGGYNINNTPQTPFSISRQNLNPVNSTIDQEGTAHTINHQSVVYSQYSYELDSLNLISAIINYANGLNHRMGSSFTRQIDNTNSSYQSYEDGRNTQHGYDLGLDYQMGFKRKKTQLLSFSYRYSDNDYHQLNLFTASQQVNSNINDYNQDNISGTKEHTLQLDYTHPLKHVDIEAGIKSIFRNNFSDYVTTLFNTGNSSVNGFNYDQDIYAAYNSYQFKLDSWTIKAGARWEMTSMKADFSSVGIVNIPDYNRVVPTIAVQKKLSKSTSINWGYTERISRPGIRQLNPYIDRQNPLSVSYGNPNLRPELNHTFSFRYSVYGNGSFNAGLDYTFSNNSIQYISLLGADGVTNNTYSNLGKNTKLSGYISTNYPLSQRLNLDTYAEISRAHLTGMIDGLNYIKNAILVNTNINLSYKMDHDWRAGFEFQYYSQTGIALQSSFSPYYYTSFSLSKSVFNKKLNIRGTASNPYLRYLNYKINYSDPHYNQVIQQDIVYRRFNIYLNYTFGKLRDAAVKKNKKSVKNDDTSTIAPPTPPGN
ncbi:MAG: outer membrane beta-barrel protein [Bacteroidota bacterium]